MSSRIQELARKVKEYPDDSFYKFALALEMQKTEQYDKARILFEDILEKDPGYLGVYYHLAKLYELLLRREDALKLYSKGIQVAEKQGDLKLRSELASAQLSLESEMKDDYENNDV